jgi:hypothetical protein
MEDLTTTTDVEAPRKKSPWPILAGLALVALLAGAAFFAGRLANRPAKGGGKGGMTLSLRTEGSGGEAMSAEINLLPAPELPKTAPEVQGLFVERQDNSLFIGTGNIEVMVDNGKASSNYDGPKVEVVVTQDTKIYRDATAPDIQSGSTTIQQKVEPGDLDEIGPQSSLTVWGKKSGDRVVAEALVYMNPIMIRGPGVK